MNAVALGATRRERALRAPATIGVRLGDRSSRPRLPLCLARIQLSDTLGEVDVGS